MTTVLAVYEGGVLRPVGPLPFGDGETIEITVSKAKAPAVSLAEDEIARRLQGAKTIEEWVVATKLLPGDDGGYDIVKAMSDNRAWSGERPAELVAGEAP